VQADTDGKTGLFHLKEYPPTATAIHILEYLVGLLLFF